MVKKGLKKGPLQKGPEKGVQKGVQIWVLFRCHPGALVPKSGVFGPLFEALNGLICGFGPKGGPKRGHFGPLGGSQGVQNGPSGPPLSRGPGGYARVLAKKANIGTLQKGSFWALLGPPSGTPFWRV